MNQDPVESIEQENGAKVVMMVLAQPSPDEAEC